MQDAIQDYNKEGRAETHTHTHSSALSVAKIYNLIGLHETGPDGHRFVLVRQMVAGCKDALQRHIKPQHCRESTDIETGSSSRCKYVLREDVKLNISLIRGKENRLLDAPFLIVCC